MTSTIEIIALELTGGRTIRLEAVGDEHRSVAITIDDSRHKGRTFQFRVPHDVAAKLRAGLDAYEARRIAVCAASEADRAAHDARVEEARRRKGPPVFTVGEEPVPSVDPRDVVRHMPGQPRGRVSP